MYGTIAKLRVKEGMLDEILKNLQREESGEGHIAHYIYQTDNDPHVFYLAVMFESKDAYHKNAARPETNAEFEKLVQFLDGEPEWHDGEIIFSQTR
jgi:quinol monooxygenase YgiN